MKKFSMAKMCIIWLLFFVQAFLDRAKINYLFLIKVILPAIF
jgi:hypothetical protein